LLEQTSQTRYQTKWQSNAYRLANIVKEATKLSGNRSPIYALAYFFTTDSKRDGKLNGKRDLANPVANWLANLTWQKTWQSGVGSIASCFARAFARFSGKLPGKTLEGQAAFASSLLDSMAN
jgi:hypothetical protein